MSSYVYHPVVHTTHLAAPPAPTMNVDANSQSEKSESKCLPPPGVSIEEYRRSRVNGPPPGLVHATPPVPASIRILGNEDVSLFGQFADYLDKNGWGVDNDGRRVHVDLKCLICLDKRICVPEGVTPDSHFDGASEFESLEVLPCGHWFGTKCIEDWFVSSSDSGNSLSCPLCRFELAYGCGHFLEPRTYDPHFPRSRTVPLTIPEGGHVPEACGSCYSEITEEAAYRLQDLLFPNANRGNLRYSESADMLRQAADQFHGRCGIILENGSALPFLVGDSVEI